MKKYKKLVISLPLEFNIGAVSEPIGEGERRSPLHEQNGTKIFVPYNKIYKELQSIVKQLLIGFNIFKLELSKY